MQIEIKTLEDLANVLREESKYGKHLAFVMFSDGSGRILPSNLIDYSSPIGKGESYRFYVKPGSDTGKIFFEDGVIDKPPKRGFLTKKLD
jgi:hypothetical protein